MLLFLLACSAGPVARIDRVDLGDRSSDWQVVDVELLNADGQPPDLTGTRLRVELRESGTPICTGETSLDATRGERRLRVRVPWDQPCRPARFGVPADVQVTVTPPDGPPITEVLAPSPSMQADAPPKEPDPVPEGPAVALARKGLTTDGRYLVLSGPGFTIQVPEGFAAAAHPTAGPAWAGTRVDGLGEPARLVAYAEVTADAGDLAAFADARAKTLGDAGAQIRLVTDANLFGFGAGPDRPAKRLVATTADTRIMTQVAVVDGRGIAVTCESPKKSLADADCANIVASLAVSGSD